MPTPNGEDLAAGPTVRAVDFHAPGPHPSRNGHALQVVEGLGRAVESGRPWADALLEAVGLWTAPEEEYEGRRFVYLIQGEAFDWLLLAERLLLEVPSAAPEPEKERLLFSGELPASITAERFREGLGVTKYRAHLNFFYGVVVEEALMEAVEQEALKEGRSRGFIQGRGVDDLVARRLYGDTYPALLQRFRLERGGSLRGPLTMGEWKAFIYWLFKSRLSRSDQARTASDTHKGLTYLATVMPSVHACVTLPVPDLLS